MIRCGALFVALAGGCAGGGEGGSSSPPTTVTLGEASTQPATDDTSPADTTTSGGADSDSSDADSSVGSGPVEGCGNNLIEINEDCDDGNEDLCDGCETCDRRAILFLDGATGTVLEVQDTLAQPLQLVPPFTVEGWFRIDGADEDLPVIKRAAGNVGYRLSVAANSIAGSVFNAFDHVASNLPIVGTGWHHVAWTYDGATSTLYLDGILAGTAAEAFAVQAADAPLRIGSWIGGDGQFVESRSGRADEVRISNLVRYTGTFEPTRRHEPDPSTILLLHLDGADAVAPLDASSNAHVVTAAGVEWEPDNGYGVAAFCE